MNSDNMAMDAALLEIAKDLLQASDDLAAADPAASAKLAQEAFEIGRDLGIVREYLEKPAEAHSSIGGDAAGQCGATRGTAASKPVAMSRIHRQEAEDESDDDLFRILDRQRAIVPDPPRA